MGIWFSVLLFAVGIVLVVKGGDWFVDAASWIARAARIPTFIIGATIVSIATTLPEMIVSIMASAEGKNDMAVGNAVGSVTANLGLIMAIAFVFLPVIAPRKKYLKQCLILIGTAGILWAGSLSGKVSLWATIALAALFILFTATTIVDAKQETETEEKPVCNRKEIIKHIVLFAVGAAAIVVGSNLLINGGSDIAVALGVPERVIAVTMVAIGTSLPEFVTTITAIRKKEANLSAGNIIGANIIDLALILPICSAVSGSSFAVSAVSLKIDFPVCFLLTLVAMIPLMIKERSYKIQGIVMLVIYAVYLAFTV
ncbi:MAG: calcium/sodium antiporter [Eubacteriales bacterium]